MMTSLTREGAIRWLLARSDDLCALQSRLADLSDQSAIGQHFIDDPAEPRGTSYLELWQTLYENVADAQCTLASIFKLLELENGTGEQSLELQTVIARLQVPNAFHSAFEADA